MGVFSIIKISYSNSNFYVLKLRMIIRMKQEQVDEATSNDRSAPADNSLCTRLNVKYKFDCLNFA